MGDPGDGDVSQEELDNYKLQFGKLANIVDTGRCRCVPKFHN